MLLEIVEDYTKSDQFINSNQAFINYISYLKDIKSTKIDSETLKEFSAPAKKALNFSNNWFKESTFLKSSEELKIITKTTLDNFKEYFKNKLPQTIESEAILNNLGSSGIFYQNIPNSPNKEALISTMQEYSAYLSKLVALLENKDLSEEESIKKVLDSLAIFPAKPNQVIFACLPGTSQRIREQSMNLDKISYDVQAVKNLLLTKTSQLAPNIFEGNQIHLESCLLFILHNDQQEISKIDGFYSTPIKNIELGDAFDFISNFSKKFDEELDKIVDNLYENYSQMPLGLEPFDNTIREEFIKKLNLSIPISTHEIFNIDEDTYELSLKSKSDFKKIIFTKIKNSQQKSNDFLREFLTPESLFYQNEEVKHIDIKKINNLINLFVFNEDKSEEQKETDIAIAIKTLNLFSEKFMSSNMLFLACFFENFEEKIGQKFEDFFYQPAIENSTRKIKPEYEKYKNIIKSTLDLYQSNLRKHYGSNNELLSLHKQIYKVGKIDDDENSEQKIELQRLISSDYFTIELKSAESNILHYPRQFFEKNTIKFILENIPEEMFLNLIQQRLTAPAQDSLRNLNPIQIATINKDQEMLLLFLELKFNHRNQTSSLPPFDTNNKFEFIKNNKLLNISLKNKDLSTFDLLLAQTHGVDLVAKINDGIENQDEVILELLKLITKRENSEFFNALKLNHPLPELISQKLIENALENDNPNALRALRIPNIIPYLPKISYKSENIVKNFFDRNFITDISHRTLITPYIKNMTMEAMENGNVETFKHLTSNSNILDHFDNFFLQKFLIKSIAENKDEISKTIIEQMLKVTSESQTSCTGGFNDIGSSNLNQQIRLDKNNNITKFPDGNSCSYLEFACKYQRTDTAKLLIEKGVKISDNCFKLAIKTKNKKILNLLINSEMTKSGKTKLAVLKEKSSVIFNKLSRYFDFEILKNLFEDLSDDDKKEFLNFNVKCGIFRSTSTVYDKILESNKILFNDSEENEILNFISHLHSIKDPINPLQITRNSSANLIYISNQRQR